MSDDNNENYFKVSTKCTKCHNYVDDFLYKILYNNHKRDLVCFNCWTILAEERCIDPLNYPRHIENGCGCVGMDVIKINKNIIKINCDTKEDAELLKDDIDNNKLYLDNINYHCRQHRVYIIYYIL